MTYMLRDRPDGQIEIVVHTPTVVGVFFDRDTAEKVRVFLQDDDSLGQVEDEPASFGRAAEDVAELEGSSLEEVVGDDLPPPQPASRPRQDRAPLLPAVIEQPTTTRFLPVVAPSKVTEEQLDRAFVRLAAGEKLVIVAADLGWPWTVLRGHWAQRKQVLQKHLAEGGQVECAHCRKPFIPSISSPDKCARCSRD